jgi:pimeloyl-ACP methyl ester carboxylesterase
VVGFFVATPRPPQTPQPTSPSSQRMTEVRESDPELEGLAGPLPEWFLDAMAVPRHSGHVDVDGCTIRYLRWGDPQAPGVVMVHGFLAHSRCFAFIAPLLARRFHVVAYDVSGYGDSDARDHYDDHTRAREMLAVADAAGMARGGSLPTLVAHSYGATLAMSAIEHLGDRFAGLIACDVLMHRPARLLAFRAGLAVKGSPRAQTPKRRFYPNLEAGMSRFRLAPPQPVENPFLLEYLARHSLEPDGDGWTWKFDPQCYVADGRDDDWWIEQPKRFARLEARKAFIYGERSQLFDADTADYLRELGAVDVPIVAIPEARHHLMLDQPLAFASALSGILEEWRTQDAR